jgi:hypothetical protein
MNDHEIEEFISHLPRPAPSKELDARIAEITSRAWTERKGSLTGRILLVIGTAACAGSLVFLLGRQSGPAVAKTETTAVPAQVPGASSHPADGPERIGVVPTEAETLAQFVMPPKPFVSLFGSGPLEIRNAPSQPQ